MKIKVQNKDDREWLSLIVVCVLALFISIMVELPAWLFF